VERTFPLCLDDILAFCPSLIGLPLFGDDFPFKDSEIFLAIEPSDSASFLEADSFFARVPSLYDSSLDLEMFFSVPRNRILFSNADNVVVPFAVLIL
jgi:hypothetical protein